MGKTVFAIVNPRAASSLAGQKWRFINRELTAAGFDVTGRFTKYRHHATELIREASCQNADIVLSVGGDGTMNEITNGLMSLDRPVGERPVLGVLSVGTGSDFARTLGFTGGYRSALRALIRGEPGCCDLGLVRLTLGARSKIRYFANVFDVGLGGSVVRIANFVPKNLGGFLTFLLSSLAGLATFKPPILRVEIDGEHATTGPITIVGCANGQYFGGGMNIAPMARLDDGRFEVLYVKDTNLFRFVRKVLIPVYKAKHLGYERLFHRSARRLTITGVGTFACDLDGEEEKADRIELTLVDRAIRILKPLTRT
jgi:YegS/Rv2252/BmrU family lipid kinase